MRRDQEREIEELNGMANNNLDVNKTVGSIINKWKYILTFTHTLL
jgi:hypothetical protein